MIRTAPIVLHLSKPDYSGVRCGGGDMLTAFWSLEAAEAVTRNKPDRYTICEDCRRQAANTKEEER